MPELSLWANAIHALEVLGLGETIRPFSAAYAVAGIRTLSGAILTSPSPDFERPGALCVVMHRVELQDVLLQAFGAECVHLAARCERFRKDAARVTVAEANNPA